MSNSEIENWKTVFFGLINEQWVLEKSLKDCLSRQGEKKGKIGSFKPFFYLKAEVAKLAEFARRKDKNAVELAQEIQSQLSETRQGLENSIRTVELEREELEKTLEGLRLKEQNLVSVQMKNVPKEEGAEPDCLLQALLKEVESKIELNGGHFCGWYKEDHEDFLKILSRNARKGRKELLEALMRGFPLFSVERVEGHLVAFETRRELEEEKRRVIAEYKAIKKKEIFKMAEGLEVEEQEQALRNEEEDRRKFESRQQENQQKLEKWKLERALSLEAEKKLKKEKLERNLLAEELRKKKLEFNRREKEKNIQLFKDRKKEEQLKLERKKALEAQMKPRIASDTAIRIKNKEEEQLRRKIESINDKKMVNDRRKMIIEAACQKYEEKYAFVGSKLEEQTITAVGKIVEKFDKTRHQPKNGENFAGVLVRTQGRRIPDWRANSS